MKGFLPLVTALLCVAARVAPAQQQEKGLTDRINAKPDMALVNPMQNQAYGSGTYGTKAFGPGTYGGVKNADVKTFETRSFFGLKNPWFGRKVYDTSVSDLERRRARESPEKFTTAAFATKQFTKGNEPDRRDDAAILPPAAAPRAYLIAGKTQPGIDRYTQNLEKDLTIDDVRDLLNKGKGE